MTSITLCKMPYAVRHWLRTEQSTLLQGQILVSSLVWARGYAFYSNLLNHGHGSLHPFNLHISCLHAGMADDLQVLVVADLKQALDTQIRDVQSAWKGREAHARKLLQCQQAVTNLPGRFSAARYNCMPSNPKSEPSASASTALHTGSEGCLRLKEVQAAFQSCVKRCHLRSHKTQQLSCGIRFGAYPCNIRVVGRAFVLFQLLKRHKRTLRMPAAHSAGVFGTRNLDIGAWHLFAHIQTEEMTRIAAAPDYAVKPSCMLHEMQRRCRRAADVSLPGFDDVWD